MDEGRIREVCARVRENVGRLAQDGKMQALDALGARVVATSERTVLYGYLPSYVTIERTSAYMCSSDVDRIPCESPLAIAV